MPSRSRRVAALVVATLALAASPAAARDYAGTALNIIPSGQYGGVPVPPGADEQARMYDALTPLFDQVTPADLDRTFKSAKLGAAAGPTRTERVPRRGDAGPAPAIWDELYPRLVDAVMGGVLGPQLREFKDLVGRTNGPSTGFTGGAINHVHKDLATLTGTRFRQPYRTRFCGGGDAAACRTALWRALDETGAALAQRQGNPDPDTWRADANAERIRFAPGLLQTTIRYTNRPSGIQQVVSFTGHRPRR